MWCIMKNKKFKPMEHIMDNIGLSAGVSIGGMMVENINASTGSHIDTGPAMNMLSKLPMIHAAGGVFKSLENLDPKSRRKHK